MGIYAFLSSTRTLIVSHGDVSKNEFAWHLGDKTCEFRRQFVHSGGASSYEPGKMVLMWSVT